MYSLVDAPKNSAVDRVVLKGEDTSLDRRLADASEYGALAAEAILPGDRVPQQDNRRIAVILKRHVEDRDGERARGCVARRIGRRTGYGGYANREARAGRRIANHSDARTVVGCHRRREVDDQTARAWAGILIGYSRLVRRAGDRRRLGVVDRDCKRAASRVA